MQNKLNHQQQIEVLHTAYTQSTGMDIALTMGRIFCYEIFVSKGWSADDIRAVAGHLKRKIKTGPTTTAALAFRNFVQSHELFEENLAECKCLSRVKRVDPARASILRTTGRDPNPVQGEARPARNIIAEMTALNELRALKESL